MLRKFPFYFSALSILLPLLASGEPAESSPPNVLFIAVDDLRPELACYGAAHIHSPNIDRLADEGVLFQNHFVNVPTCGASRHCLLTGRLPTSRKHLRNDITATTTAQAKETEVPESFIHQLRRNGYYTVGIGKISHSPDGRVYGYREEKSDVLELPYSWDEMLLDDGKWGTGHNAFFGYADGTNRNALDKQVKPYEAADVGDEGYVDGLTAQVAIRKLKELEETGRPFFLGVGFFKPHLPFNAPEKYWDQYDRSALPTAPYADIPANASKASLHGSGEFNQYKLGEEKASLQARVSDAYARKLRHAYAASVSYIDAQVGKLLETLEALNLNRNTVIVLWGDHGWHLGDHLVWGKHTVFDRSLKSALIIKTPDSKSGSVVKEVVSTTDLYPTILDLTGLGVEHEIDGQSLQSFLQGNEVHGWRNTAFSYHLNGSVSLRTQRYRLTRYTRKAEPRIELYDLKADPNETRNIAEENPGLVERLLPELRKGDTGLFAPTTRLRE
mgnify:CR=1 FL=1